MKRRTSTAVAAVFLTALVSAGVTAPAASAAPGGHGKSVASAKAGKSTKAKPAKPAKSSKADVAAKRLAVEQRTVSAFVTRKDVALTRAASKVTESGVAQADAVLANIAADRAVVADLLAAVSAATTVAEVRTVKGDAKLVRPEVYSEVLDGVLQAAVLQEVAAANQAALADLTAQADAKEGEGYDVSAVRAEIASATANNDQVTPLALAAVEKGVALNALSTHAERDAFAADLEAAAELLDTVAAQLVVIAELLAAAVLAPAPEEPVV